MTERDNGCIAADIVLYSKNTMKIFLQNPLTNRVGDDIIVKLTHSRTSSKNENASKKFEKSVDK